MLFRSNPVRDEVYVANSFAGTISRIDLATREPTGVFAVDRTPVGLAAAARGDRLYVSCRGAGTVSVVGSEGGSEWARIPVGEGPGGCTIDPTTGWVLVANAGSCSLTVFEDLLSGPAVAADSTEPLLGRQLPPFALRDLRTGEIRTSREWAERKYILNFFASW